MNKKVLINMPSYIVNTCSQSGYVNIISDALKDHYDVYFTASAGLADEELRPKVLLLCPESDGFFGKVVSYIKFNIQLYWLLKRDSDMLLISFSESIVPFFYKRQITFIHDLLQLEFPRKRSVYFFYRYFVTYIARRVSLVITTSRTAKISLDKYNISSSVVYRMHKKSNIERSVSKVREKKFLGIFVGTMAAHKNFQFIEALAEQLPGERFAAILPTRNAKNYLKSDNITIFSNLSENEYYDTISDSEFFISPSFNEGFGPVFDAISVNVKCLVSDIPVYRELFSNASWFFDPENPAECVELINMYRGTICNDDAYSDLRKLIVTQQDTFKKLLMSVCDSK